MDYYKSADNFYEGNDEEYRNFWIKNLNEFKAIIWSTKPSLNHHIINYMSVKQPNKTFFQLNCIRMNLQWHFFDDI